MTKRNTIQKQLILNAVAQLNIHATAEQVYEFIVRDNPTISKATVYRNLSTMAQDGILLDAGNFSGSTHYDHNTHKHYHAACSKCYAVFDIDGDLDAIVNDVNSPANFTVTGYNVSFSGICNKCNGDNS